MVTVCATGVRGQSDSVAYRFGDPLEEGVYLTYYDFRHNNRLSRDQLVSDVPRDQLEFIGKTLSVPNFTYRSGNEIMTVPSASVFGFVQNNAFYRNYKGDFYRVPVFGVISYFVANVLVVTSTYYDPRFGFPSGNVTTRELHEFLFDFYDGQISELSMERAEQLLGRDPALLDEFLKLKRKKRKEMLYGFIRRFNAAHPVYFLR